MKRYLMSVMCAATLCQAPVFAELSVYGDFLYWKVVQDQIPYAVSLPGGISGLINNLPDFGSGSGSGGPVHFHADLDTIDPDFDLEPGFRVGIAYEDRCSSWDLNLFWTSLHTKETSNAVSKERGIIPTTIPVASAFGFVFASGSSDFGFASSAKSVWDFQFDAVDLQLGRSVCLLQDTIFRPYVGIKGANIMQRQENSFGGFFDPQEVVINALDTRTNKFRGVGLSFGLDTRWNFASCLNLVAGASSSYLCGQFITKNDPRATSGLNLIGVSTKANKNSRIRPMAETYLGLDWTGPLCNGLEITLAVAYEMQYWWNQWQVTTTVVSDVINNAQAPQGDLMMQGLTVRLAFSF